MRNLPNNLTWVLVPAGGPAAARAGDPPVRPPPAPAPSTSGASAESSERERLLLERIERLERRVTELESEKVSTAGTTPAKATPPSPPQGTPSVANPNQAAVAPAEPRSPQTLSASQAERPPTPDPFAFADFSWLSGNSRAKTSPIDTKAVTGEMRFDTSY